jgi:hypothetical protein
VSSSVAAPAPGGGGGDAVFQADAQDGAPLVVDPRLNVASVSTALTGTDGAGNPVAIHLTRPGVEGFYPCFGFPGQSRVDLGIGVRLDRHAVRRLAHAQFVGTTVRGGELALRHARPLDDETHLRD